MKTCCSIFLILVLVVSCGQEDPAVLASDTDDSGAVLVFVHWNGQGLAGKRVELPEAGIEAKTNREGLAEFVVPAGRYTLRVWGINVGGPVMRYVDSQIVVKPEDTLRVDIVDCLPCV